MKKKLTLVLFVVSLIFMISDQAMAGWSAWYNSTVPVNGSFTTYFIPVKAGNHKIEFLNQASIYNGGTMDSEWASSNNLNAWYDISTSDVLNRTRSQNLYAGSSDILFRFTFWNIQSVPVTFYYRFYTN